MKLTWLIDEKDLTQLIHKPETLKNPAAFETL